MISNISILTWQSVIISLQLGSEHFLFCALIIDHGTWIV